MDPVTRRGVRPAPGPGRRSDRHTTAVNGQTALATTAAAEPPVRRRPPGSMPPMKPSRRTVELTTTPTFEGRRIVRYCGIVTGEAILGANIFKDILAGLRDIVGGRSATYERELQAARATALDELRAAAHELSANGVVGIDLDYEVIGAMLMVAASGTAVVVE